MKVLIIYNSFDLARKANAMLQRGDAIIHWTITPWQMDALRFPPVAEEALADAADAQVILLAIYRDHGLPAWLQRWLDRWAARRQFGDALLAVFGGGSNTGALASSGLSEFAGRHRLSFITETAQAVEISPEECEVPATSSSYCRKLGEPPGVTIVREALSRIPAAKLLSCESSRLQDACVEPISS